MKNESKVHWITRNNGPNKGKVYEVISIEKGFDRCLAVFNLSDRECGGTNIINNVNNTGSSEGRQWSGITKEIWERGERIDEEGMQKTYEKLIKKRQEEKEK